MILGQFSWVLDGYIMAWGCRGFEVSTPPSSVWDSRGESRRVHLKPSHPLAAMATGVLRPSTHSEVA